MIKRISSKQPEKKDVYALKIKNKSHSRFFMGNGASEKRMKIMSLKF